MTGALVIPPREVTDSIIARTGKTATSPDAVRAQLSRILNSKAFARSPRISRFLTFVVEQTLDGQESKLKEYLLGVEVFGRLDSFDPRIDSIVRVEARRLRYKLDRYYDNEGLNDAVHIQFRKGCYIPTFSGKRESDGAGNNGEISDVPYIRAIQNPHAFAQYARGRYCLGQWTAEGIAEAVSCFTQALDADSECAAACAGLATAWMFAAMLGFMPARDVAPKAKTAAQRALAISPNLSEAHAILGVVSALYGWEWTDAEARLRKAIHANPSAIEARLWYGLYLTLAGRPEDGIREARRAQQAAPTSLTAHLLVGFACHSRRAYEEALLQYRLARDLNPAFFCSYLAMGLLLTDQSMFEQASHMLNRAVQLQPRNPAVLAAVVYGHAAAHREAACRCALGELAEMANQQYVCPLTQALAYSAAGDADTAFRKLDEAVKERSVWLPIIRFTPAFERLSQDLRFAGLLAQINP